MHKQNKLPFRSGTQQTNVHLNKCVCVCARHTAHTASNTHMRATHTLFSH
eukprot:m.376455 g.376455  ORF g.376455 m.376455 type:complete len:50 (+) comp83377_c0_seq1:116-265(+)